MEKSNYFKQNSHVLPSNCPLIRLRFFISSMTRRMCTGFAPSFLATLEAVVVGFLKISSIAAKTILSVNLCWYLVESFVLSMTYYQLQMYKYFVPYAIYGKLYITSSAYDIWK